MASPPTRPAAIPPRTYRRCITHLPSAARINAALHCRFPCERFVCDASHRRVESCPSAVRSRRFCYVGHMTTRLWFLRRLDLFEGMSDAEMERLGSLLRMRSCRSGLDVVVRRDGAGAGGEGMFDADLARMIGASRGTVSRWVADGERRGIVRGRRRLIELADGAALQRLSAGPGDS